MQEAARDQFVRVMRSNAPWILPGNQHRHRAPLSGEGLHFFDVPKFSERGLRSYYRAVSTQC